MPKLANNAFQNWEVNLASLSEVMVLGNPGDGIPKPNEDASYLLSCECMLARNEHNILTEPINNGDAHGVPARMGCR